MSQTIDRRVVEMAFDNSQFEKNIKTSMSSISDLKKGLNFGGSVRSIGALGRSVQHVNFSTMANGIETIVSRFSLLGAIGFSVINNLVNSAMAAGKKIVSALTVEPISKGFQEYETQMNAVQTILANTKKGGPDLTDVTGALDELNDYADKTIYNFTEMTRNIGTFTAAGVKLDASVSAIKGIANLAAISGSNSQQASTAMYQLSQALSSGTVRLMDWNSVVNVLTDLGLPLTAIFSTLGRTAARGLEASWAAHKMRQYTDELVATIKAGDTACANVDKWEPCTWDKKAQGHGFVEAPRGALGHWIVIENERIANYQCIVPTTWNASPRGKGGEIGAYEASLMNTPMEVADQPVEILRTIHSFDTCLACATHVMSPDGRELTTVKVR